ncbi:MAG TPA: hypothetical protein VMD30_04090 [Tepidisphaeraceae bacterium]|nr:hypothetical protein [Tepidisphaeraceae bacterium]
MRNISIHHHDRGYPSGRMAREVIGMMAVLLAVGLAFTVRLELALLILPALAFVICLLVIWDDRCGHC